MLAFPTRYIMKPKRAFFGREGGLGNLSIFCSSHQIHKNAKRFRILSSKILSSSPPPKNENKTSSIYGKQSSDDSRENYRLIVWNNGTILLRKRHIQTKQNQKSKKTMVSECQGLPSDISIWYSNRIVGLKTGPSPPKKLKGSSCIVFFYQSINVQTNGLYPSLS